MFEDPAWPCALSTPHVCHPSESPGPPFRGLRIQLFTFADFSVEESLCAVGHKIFVSLNTSVETPFQEHAGALNCCCCCKTTFVTLRFFLTSRSVLGSPNCWRFHRVHTATRHDVWSSRQIVFVHLFEDFHALQEIRLFLTSLLFGSH